MLLACVALEIARNSDYARAEGLWISDECLEATTNSRMKIRGRDGDDNVINYFELSEGVRRTSVSNCVFLFVIPISGDTQIKFQLRLT